MSVPTPALNRLTVAENRELLDALLDAQPALRELAEQLAVQQLSTVGPAAVADDVALDLCSADIEDLNGRAGHQPGIGYVHPVEAAAVAHAVGILRGLHRLRANSSETLPEYSPDYADERAAKVVRQWAVMGVALPLDDLAGVLSGWEPLIQHSIGPRAEGSTR